MSSFCLDMSSEGYYSNRTNSQREHRAEKRKQTALIPVDSDSSSSDSDDLVNNTTDYQSSIQTNYSFSSNTLNNIHLRDYVADEHDNIGEDAASGDHSPLLYSNISHTVSSATISIMRFVISANLDKSHSTQLLKLIKSLLPKPNLLLISHKQILKVFDRTSTFTTKYLCTNCDHDTVVLQSGLKRCSNINCGYSNETLVNNRLTEVVTMNIRSLSSFYRETKYQLDSY